ncbi:MAG: cytochrome c3 family protein [Nitrospirota bacterium]
MKGLVLVIMLSVFTARSAFPAEKHECSYCHIPHGMSEGILLKAPLSDLCFECHPDRKSPNEHKVDIMVSRKVEDLPLSDNGKMTCITCHDPHGKSSYPKLLRINPSELCLKCHFR